MEVLLQKCQKCGGTEMVNILSRATGESDKVYLRCVACKEFVARYKIAQKGYHHQGKGFESHLRSLNRGGFYESGKEIIKESEELEEICEREFSNIIKELDKRK